MYFKCILSEWFIWFGFSLCLSALVVKVLRVYLIFVKFTFKKNVAKLVAPWKVRLIVLLAWMHSLLLCSCLCLCSIVLYNPVCLSCVG